MMSSISSSLKSFFPNLLKVSMRFYLEMEFVSSTSNFLNNLHNISSVSESLIERVADKNSV